MDIRSNDDLQKPLGNLLTPTDQTTAKMAGEETTMGAGWQKGSGTH